MRHRNKKRTLGLVGKTSRFKSIAKLSFLLVFASLSIQTAADTEEATPANQDILKVMFDELKRSFKKLQDQPEPPYFLSYEITEDVALTVMGSYGSITHMNELVSRYLDVDLRVGDYSVDNTHPLRSNQGELIQETLSSPQSIAVEDPDALRAALWYHTDNAFRSAVTRFSRVKSVRQTAGEDRYYPGDFSPSPVARFEEDTLDLEADLELWASKIRLYTKPFSKSEWIETNSAIVMGDIETRWLVNSEGTRVKVSTPYYRLLIEATTKADDGMVLALSRNFDSRTPDGVFDDAKVLHAVNDMLDDLATLRTAPVVDPYAGPAILSARSAGVFFHEVLGHRLEGHRQRRVDDHLSLYEYLGKRLLPRTFSVYFDPSITTFGGVELLGSYKYDNQGARGRRVNAIKNGIVRSFLMSRTPISGFSQTNGHGRKNFSHPVHARQSNLFVDVSNARSKEQLDQMLIDRITGEGKSFGLYFEELASGFNLVQRNLPSAFNITPVLVYKVYPDARRELVRGVDLIGTPLTMFSHIEAGASDYEVWNQICDDESGQVPVSSIAPSIFVSQVEVQKAESSRSIPRILSSPVVAGQESSDGRQNPLP